MSLCASGSSGAYNLLVWLSAIICMGILVLDRPLVTTLADLLGIAYAPAALFVAGFTLGFLLLLNFSVAISRLIERNKRLTQEIGLLMTRLADDEAKVGISCGSAYRFGAVESGCMTAPTARRPGEEDKVMGRMLEDICSRKATIWFVLLICFALRVAYAWHCRHCTCSGRWEDLLGHCR